MLECITPVAPVSLLHVERSAAWAELVANEVKPRTEFRLSGHAGTLARARELLRTVQPDILLFEPWLPDGDGLDLVRQLRRSGSKTRIVVCTARSDEVMLYHFDRLRLDGLVWKELPLSQTLRLALTAAQEGRRYFPPELEGVRRQFRTGSAAWFKLLSDRELELLPRLGVGQTDADIAAFASVSAHTIHSHRQSIMRKLGLHRTVDLVRWAEATGFVRPTGGLEPVSSPAFHQNRCNAGFAH